MPRVEIYARWDLGDEGIYESLVASIGVPRIALVRPDLHEEVVDTISKAMIQAARYEKGKPTDMARRVADR